MSVKIVAAINDMNRRGHNARLYKHGGQVWVEIDHCMLASFDEIEKLVDGVHSFQEQADLFKKRHAEELSGLYGILFRSGSRFPTFVANA